MKRANLILLIDSSSSIKGKKPGALVDAAQNIVQMFQAISLSNDQFEGYIGAMSFGLDVSFFPLQKAKDFTLIETEFKGDTQMGAMLSTLSQELSSSEKLSSTGDYKNILVLLSDGGATDLLSDGYLEILRNPAFIHSRRIAVSIGDRVNRGILSSFCTMESDLFKAEDIEPVNDVLRYTIDKLVSLKPTLKYVQKKQNDSEWD